MNLPATVADTVLSDGLLFSRGGHTPSASVVAADTKSTAEDVLYAIDPYPLNEASLPLCSVSIVECKVIYKLGGHFVAPLLNRPPCLPTPLSVSRE